MKSTFTIVLLIFKMNGVIGQCLDEYNDPQKYPNNTNKIRIDSLHGKPIQFYLTNKNIDLTAKLLYNGKWAIFDDDKTLGVMDSVLTDNSQTRPFYFFLLNRIMDHADGAVAEYVSYSCDRYIRKFPCEFIKYTTIKDYPIDIKRWASIIGNEIQSVNYINEYEAPIKKNLMADCPSKIKRWNEIKEIVKRNLESY